MKKVLVYLLATIFCAILTVSCNDTPAQEEEENQNSGENTEQPQLKPGTYNLTASTMKEKWEAGDVVYIKGGTGATAESIALKASDISNDGKTASIQLGDITSDYLSPDGLYAAWPDEAVQHSFGLLRPRTSFTRCDTLLCVAYLQGDTFSFIDASTAVDFTVSGGYDRYAFAASSMKGLLFAKADVEYSSTTKKISPKQNNGYPFIYGDIVNGERNRILFTGDVALEGGYTLFLSKDRKWCATYAVTSDVTLKAGVPLNLGDITSKVAAYDGPEPKIPEMGKYTKYTVEDFPELSGLCLSEDEDFLWAVGDEGDLGKISFTGEVLYTFHIGGDAEDVSRDPRSGNLLIGLEPKGVGVVEGPDFNTKVSTLFNIDACKNYGNAGIEGLTYYKDGKILVGAQSNSHLFLCDLDTKQVIWDNMLWDKDLITEVGGLCYDPLTDWLWVIDSEAKKIFVIRLNESDGSFSLVGAYPVSDVANPESVCVDHKHSCVWVGDDLGDDTSYLFKYEFTGLDDANLE